MKQKQNTFSVLFYIRRAQANKQGESAVMCRITVRGERENFTTRVSAHTFTSYRHIAASTEYRPFSHRFSVGR